MTSLESSTGNSPTVAAAVAQVRRVDRFVSRRAVLVGARPARTGPTGRRDDRGDPRTYSTAPSGCCRADFGSGTGGGRRGGAAGVSHWQDHWRQCLFVKGDGRSPATVSSRMLTRGVPVTMIASHDDTSISFFSIDTGCRRRVSRK